MDGGGWGMWGDLRGAQRMEGVKGVKKDEGH